MNENPNIMLKIEPDIYGKYVFIFLNKIKLLSTNF